MAQTDRRVDAYIGCGCKDCESNRQHDESFEVGMAIHALLLRNPDANIVGACPVMQKLIDEAVAPWRLKYKNKLSAEEDEDLCKRAIFMMDPIGHAAEALQYFREKREGSKGEKAKPADEASSTKVHTKKKKAKRHCGKHLVRGKWVK